MDQITGVRIVLELDPRAESFRQLLAFDLGTVQRGLLHYDMHRQRWRSELDEQTG
jgi:hypothetical protein